MNAHHLDTCLETEIECPLGCGASMLRKDLGSSTESGIERKVDSHTEHDQDGLDFHLAECPNIKLKCVYRCIGCWGTNILRKEMDEHLVREAQPHAKLVAGALEKQEAALEDAQNWVGKILLLNHVCYLGSILMRDAGYEPLSRGRLPGLMMFTYTPFH